MSPSSAIRASGLSVLAALNGEALSLGTGTNVIALVQGTVNRQVAVGKDVLAKLGGKDGAIDFDVLGMSSIEIARSYQQPAPGQWFADELNIRHRICYVSSTDISWVCYCMPTLMTAPLSQWVMFGTMFRFNPKTNEYQTLRADGWHIIIQGPDGGFGIDEEIKPA